MRSLFATLLSLVLPAGATSGPRLILDGVNAQILLYNLAGLLYGSITPAGGFQVFNPSVPGQLVGLDILGGLPVLQLATGDADEDVPGRLIGVVDGVGGTRNLLVDIASGNFAGGDRGRIVLSSSSQDGTEPSHVNVDASDVRLLDESLPRGIVDQFFDDADGATFTGDSVTDMVINNVASTRGGVIGGRTYEVHLHTLVELSAAAGQWNVFLRVNGSNLGRFDRLVGAEVQRPMVDASLFWTPAVDSSTDDLDVFVDEVVGGADLTLLGSADDLLRTLTVTDLGVL